MKYSSTYAISLLAVALNIAAKSATGDRLLVVLEQAVKKESYSQFWASLQERGFDLTFKTAKDDQAYLEKYGEPQFDHLILFAPTAKSFSTPLTPQAVLSAQLKGLNTLYLLSSQISEINRDTLREYDLEPIERDTQLLDSFSHPSSSPPSTVLLPAHSTLIPNGPILSPTTLSGGPIVYPSGTAWVSGLNPYLIDVLHGGRTSYVGEDRILDEDEVEVESQVKGGNKEVVVGGKRAGVVSAMQTRGNVRVGFVGSGEMFDDEWWGKEVDGVDGKRVVTGNAHFAEVFTKWIFQETGVVKVVDSTHFRKGETEPRELYRIKDDLTYTLTLAQHSSDKNTSSWIPFQADDLQLDFTMLDPHVRTALIEDKSITSVSGTTYKATFIAPDRHGVFKFVVEYWRPGWSYIQTSSTASVVPFRHDEYPRFILGAWPFYSSAISTSIAFLLFVGIWIGLGEGSGDRKGKKKAE